MNRPIFKILHVDQLIPNVENRCVQGRNRFRLGWSRTCEWMCDHIRSRAKWAWGAWGWTRVYDPAWRERSFLWSSDLDAMLLDLIKSEASLLGSVMSKALPLAGIVSGRISWYFEEAEWRARLMSWLSGQIWDAWFERPASRNPESRLSSRGLAGVAPSRPERVIGKTVWVTESRV